MCPLFSITVNSHCTFSIFQLFECPYVASPRSTNFCRWTHITQLGSADHLYLTRNEMAARTCTAQCMRFALTSVIDVQSIGRRLSNTSLTKVAISVFTFQRNSIVNHSATAELAYDLNHRKNKQFNFRTLRKDGKSSNRMAQAPLRSK